MIQRRKLKGSETIDGNKSEHKMLLSQSKLELHRKDPEITRVVPSFALVELG